MNSDPPSAPALRRPTLDFATAAPSSSAKVHDINYILGPSAEKPPSIPTPRSEGVPSPASLAPVARAEDASTAASLLTNFSNARQSDADGLSVQYTPTTHRISKAKKGKKVHVCEFGCGKVRLVILATRPRSSLTFETGLHPCRASKV